LIVREAVAFRPGEVRAVEQLLIGGTIERGEPRYTLHPGRAWERIACTGAVRDAIGDAGVFVYGTLSQRTAAGFAQWQLAIEAARRSVKVYDANLRPNDQASHAIGSALEHADVVKLNDREVAQLESLGPTQGGDQVNSTHSAKAQTMAPTIIMPNTMGPSPASNTSGPGSGLPQPAPLRQR
jgi:sugar/nucleoside kinase (ribokinase family)